MATESWQGFERRDFTVDGRLCLLVIPKEPAAGKPWIWRTEFFGHEPQADVALLGKGWHVAYMQVSNMYGAPVALDHMDKFYDHLRRDYGLSANPATVRNNGRTSFIVAPEPGSVALLAAMGVGAFAVARRRS